MAAEKADYSTTDRIGLGILALGGLCFFGVFASVLLGTFVDKSFGAYAQTFGWAFLAVMFGGFALFFVVGTFLEARRGEVHLELRRDPLVEPGEAIPVAIRFEVQQPQRVEEAYVQIVCVPEVRGDSSRRREHRSLTYRARVELARDFEVAPGAPWVGKAELTVPRAVSSEDRVRGPGLGVDVGDVFGAALQAVAPGVELPSRPEYPGLETRAQVAEDAAAWVQVRTVEDGWRQRYYWQVEAVFRLDERCEKLASERLRVVEPEGLSGPSQPAVAGR